MYIHEQFNTSAERNAKFQELRRTHGGVVKYSEPFKCDMYDVRIKEKKVSGARYKTLYYVAYPQLIITDYKEIISAQAAEVSATETIINNPELVNE